MGFFPKFMSFIPQWRFLAGRSMTGALFSGVHYTMTGIAIWMEVLRCRPYFLTYKNVFDTVPHDKLNTSPHLMDFHLSIQQIVTSYYFQSCRVIWTHLLNG